MKTIGTLADVFRLAHHSLLKLKKYEGIVYHDQHAIVEINEITDSTTNANIINRSKTLDKDPQDKTNKNYTFWGNSWKYGKFGHSAKECQNNLIMTNQDQSHNGPTNIQTTKLNRYPKPISLTRPPILTQQIMVDFHLSQEAWKKLSNQMN